MPTVGSFLGSTVAKDVLEPLITYLEVGGWFRV